MILENKLQKRFMKQDFLKTSSLFLKSKNLAKPNIIQFRRCSEILFLIPLGIV